LQLQDEPHKDRLEWYFFNDFPPPSNPQNDRSRIIA
jgi:hypothetical protein